jgi:hypothetical protein
MHRLGGVIKQPAKIGAPTNYVSIIVLGVGECDIKQVISAPLALNPKS